MTTELTPNFFSFKNYAQVQGTRGSQTCVKIPRVDNQGGFARPISVCEEVDLGQNDDEVENLKDQKSDRKSLTNLKEAFGIKQSQKDSSTIKINLAQTPLNPN